MSQPLKRPPYHALRHRDYRRLVWGYLVSGTGSQMQSVAINWHVYLLTRSPLALGFVGLSRVIPIVVFLAFLAVGLPSPGRSTGLPCFA